MAQLLREQALLADTTETVLALPPPDWSDIPDGINAVGASPTGEGTAPRWSARRWRKTRKSSS